MEYQDKASGCCCCCCVSWTVACLLRRAVLVLEERYILFFLPCTVQVKQKESHHVRALGPSIEAKLPVPVGLELYLPLPKGGLWLGEDQRNVVLRPRPRLRVLL